MIKEQVYKKIGRKYIPLGYSDGWQGFPSDGVWVVQTKPGSKSSECVIKIADNRTVIPYAANILNYRDSINEFLLNDPRFNVVNSSINHFTTDLLKMITIQDTEN